MESACLEGGRLILLAATLSGMRLLSGGAEVILQTWVVLVALWIVQLTQRNTRSKSMIFRFLAAGSLAAGLAAIQLLPFLDLLSHSQRSASYGSGAMGKIAAIP